MKMSTQLCNDLQVRSLKDISLVCRSSNAEAKPEKKEIEDREARDRFGNAKSISSAQFQEEDDDFKKQENQVNFS